MTSKRFIMRVAAAVLLGLAFFSSIYQIGTKHWTVTDRTSNFQTDEMYSNDDESPDNDTATTFTKDFVCHKAWGRNLELFLPIPPNDTVHLTELANFILPSLALFWPMDSLNLLVITDGEKAAPTLNDSVFSLASRVGINTSLAKVRMAYNFMTFPVFTLGWDRQQWLMFWADNFTTSAEYVGFIDTDTVFVTPVMRSDLFVGDRPIVRGIYGEPENDWWAQATGTTFEAIGKLEPMNCMAYFPVIIKTRHLPLIREHIRKKLNARNFDQAFSVVYNFPYLQFSIMCAYLWHFKHKEYYWVIRQRKPNWNGPYVRGQINREADAVRMERYFARQLPSVAIHFGCSNLKDHLEEVHEIFRTGYCYAMLAVDKQESPTLCANYTSLATHPNIYEWTFDKRNFLHDNETALAAQAKRLSLVNMCPRHWDSWLLEKHLSVVTHHHFEPLL